MRLYPLKDITEGMVLGKSIYNMNGTLLLGAGFRINLDIISKLNARGYTHVYIMEEGTEEIIPEDVISEEHRLQAKMKLADKVEVVKNIANFKNLTIDKATDLMESGYLEKVSISFELRKLVKEILRDISETGSKFMNTIMIKSKDSYFLDHSINTTVLAILIGSKYRFSNTELTSLALGTLLHDIGKIIIEQLDETSKSKAGANLYKEHPTFGYILLKNSPDVTILETQIVNQHHEFQDGSGFPIGLKGQNLPPVKDEKKRENGHIFRLAEITCVANAFDNLVLNPLQTKNLTPQDALGELIINAGSHFNRDIIETLHQVVPMFPVGTHVKITDIVDPNLIGCYGVVAKINEAALNKPIIIITSNKKRKKIKPIMIDTSRLNRIELKLII
ncbi:HD domain-containing protein [bacterium]|nr:HD domain-containing protein [bacterium]